VIVSDGSTDGTDELVKKYASQHEWIEFVRAAEHGERHFAGKVAAFNAGYDRVKELSFDVIGNSTPTFLSIPATILNPSWPSLPKTPVWEFAAPHTGRKESSTRAGYKC